MFAGIGTVSDSMPLLYENRQLVRDAVSIAKMIYGGGESFAVSNIQGHIAYKKAFWGMYHMLMMCTEKGYLKDGESSINEEFFGFYFSPIFNSVKRMEGDMKQAFGVFFDNDSIALAEELYELNLKRREMTQQAYDAIMARPQPYAPYIYFSDAKSGMLGLIAGKMMNESGLPVFVVRDDADTAIRERFHGSGRSPEWFDAQASVGHLISIAGHANAFGFGCNSETSLQRAFTVLCHDVPEARAAAQIAEPVPDFVIATDLSGDIGINIPVFQEYMTERENYRPFGRDFPAPLGLLKFFGADVEKVVRIGTAKQHLKIVLPNGFEVLCWNQGSFAATFSPSDVLYVDGDIGSSEYRGRTTMNFCGTIRKEGD
jgi:single-stranded-DNA-specific exonuclease